MFLSLEDNRNLYHLSSVGLGCTWLVTLLRTGKQLYDVRLPCVWLLTLCRSSQVQNIRLHSSWFATLLETEVYAKALFYWIGLYPIPHSAGYSDEHVPSSSGWGCVGFLTRLGNSIQHKLLLLDWVALSLPPSDRVVILALD